MNKPRGIPLLVVFVLLLLPLGQVSNAANAPSAWQFGRSIGQLGGTVATIAVRGDLAAIGEGGALVLIDASDPAAPVTLGRSLPLPYLIRAITIAGDYAYVVGFNDARSSGGVHVFHLAGLDAPVQRYTIDTGGTAQDAAVDGSHLYVTGAGGLAVYDLVDPAAPALATRLSAGWSGGTLEVAGDLLYVTTSKGLRILSIADPARPVEVGFYDPPLSTMSVLDVAVAGDFAYIACGFDGLRVLDVSDPAAPARVTTYSPAQTLLTRVAVSGGFAYMAELYTYGFPEPGLRVLDVSEPAAPVEAGYYDTSPHRLEAIAVSGERAYLAAGDGDVHILTVVNPRKPLPLGVYGKPPGGHGIAVAGHHAYVTDPNGILQRFDVSDPARPIWLGPINLPGEVYKAIVQGDRLIVAAGDGGLRVLSLADPAAPVELGSLATPGTALDLAVAGDTAYVAAGFGGLYIIDIADPAAPALAGHLPVGGLNIEFNSVAVAGDYAYVGRIAYPGPKPYNRVLSVEAFNVADPAAIMWAGGDPLWDEAKQMVPIGPTLYANQGGLLTVIDITTPGSPRVSFHLPAVGAVCGMELAGDIALISACDHINLLDVTDPAAPVFAGGAMVPEMVVGAVAAGDEVYAASTHGGLLIMRFDPAGFATYLPLGVRDFP